MEFNPCLTRRYDTLTRDYERFKTKCNKWNLFALKTGEAGADLTTRPLFTADHNHTNT